MTAPLELRLTLYPDPLLRKVAQPVAAFDSALEVLVRGMFDLMYGAKGVGLAAPQAGVDRRILVLNPSGDPAARDQELALVNARILARTGELSLYEEGCLSFPQIYAEVKRQERCKVAFQGLDGSAVEREFDGFASRIVQHEYDHLEGVLLVDRMSPADKQRHKVALQELVDRYKRARAGQRA